MDVRQLEMFRAVAEEASFTRAARRLNVSQSAVSRQLQLLEAEVGGPLLHRSPKGITLTAEGELLLRTANRVHRDIREAMWEISETQKLKRGRLSIAGGMTACMYVLPKLLKRFRAIEIAECPFVNLPEARSGRWGHKARSAGNPTNRRTGIR